ncbi:MAG: TetR/AcrR family transcriptional regulator [Myxococcales bacterium]|nr:TetR/AcrR family transcriptional regulator [Myxococcales bacterium]
MSPPPSADTRERVLLEAAKLFADRGFDAPSVREICDAAGVSKPTLYYYFESRDGLVDAVVAMLYTDFQTLVAELFDPASASLDGFIAGFTRLFDRIDGRAWAVRLWSRMPGLVSQQRCCAANDRKAESHVVRYVSQIDGLPANTDAEAATWLLLASFGPIAAHKQAVPAMVSNATLAERLVRQALGVPRPLTISEEVSA